MLVLFTLLEKCFDRNMYKLENLLSNTNSKRNHTTEPNPQTFNINYEYFLSIPTLNLIDEKH